MTPDPVFDLSGKLVLIAGAAGGIGSAVALDMQRRGARLILLDRDESRLRQVADNLQLTGTRVVSDITDEAPLQESVRRAVDGSGNLDVVVNAAGVLPIASAMDVDIATFRDCLDINITGALILSRAAVRLAADASREGLSIIHVASVSSQVANPNYAAYASSKAGLAQLVRVLAREWAGSNIRVNAVGPALIDTPLTADYLASEQFRNNAIASIPLGRLATAADLVPTILMLATAAGKFITGQTIYVDGGRTVV